MDRIFWKKLLENKELVFKNGVKNIQAAAYNGARTVSKITRAARLANYEFFKILC